MRYAMKNYFWYTILILLFILYYIFYAYLYSKCIFQKKISCKNNILRYITIKLIKNVSINVSWYIHIRILICFAIDVFYYINALSSNASNAQYHIIVWAKIYHILKDMYKRCEKIRISFAIVRNISKDFKSLKNSYLFSDQWILNYVKQLDLKNNLFIDW